MTSLKQLLPQRVISVENSGYPVASTSGAISLHVIVEEYAGGWDEHDIAEP